MGWKKLPSGGWVLESGNRRATLHKRVSGIHPWGIQRWTRLMGERKWTPIKLLMTFTDESEARAFGVDFVVPWRERHGSD